MQLIDILQNLVLFGMFVSDIYIDYDHTGYWWQVAVVTGASLETSN